MDGRAAEEGRISKDGRRLITPRDIRSFASGRRKGIAGRKRERSREHRNVNPCARILRTCALGVEARRTRAYYSNAKYIYALPVIHRYRLAVAAFVLLHKVYRITQPLRSSFSRPSSFFRSFRSLRSSLSLPAPTTMQQCDGETRERDKLTR